MAAHSVLENVNLAAWIRWHEAGGFWIPNVLDLVTEVLPTHFPGMTENPNRAHYVHRSKMFLRGRRDLLPEVQSRSKESTSTSQGAAEGQPPAPNTPAVRQPRQDARIKLLENKVAELKKELEEKRALVRPVSSGREAALPVEGADSDQHPVDGAGHSGGNHDGFAPGSSIGAYHGMAHMGPETTGTIDPALFQLPAPARSPSNTTPFASSSYIPHHYAPVVQVASSTQGRIMDGAGLTSRLSYEQQPNIAGASAGVQTPRTLGPQQPVLSVPGRSPPPSPSSWIDWQFYFQVFGPSNSGVGTSSEGTWG